MVGRSSKGLQILPTVSRPSLWRRKDKAQLDPPVTILLNVVNLYMGNERREGRNGREKVALECPYTCIHPQQ